MQLTLKQAADRLGKSLRQVRYMVQQGKLAAVKVEGRWLIPADALPLSDGREAARARATATLDAQVEKAVEAHPEAAPQRRFSVRDLKAFQLAQPLYARTREALGPEHAATLALLDTLEHLTRGCHRYAWPEKGSAYGAARDTASRAVCLLLLEDEAAAAIATEAEQELMPALGGLIRRVERKVRR